MGSIGLGEFPGTTNFVPQGVGFCGNRGMGRKIDSS